MSEISITFSEIEAQISKFRGMTLDMLLKLGLDRNKATMVADTQCRLLNEAINCPQSEEMFSDANIARALGMVLMCILSSKTENRVLN